MRRPFVSAALSFVFLAAVVPAGVGADAPAPKVTYQDHVAPVFRMRCGSCHNADKQKGGLNLDNYGAMMQGGGSGKVVEPGAADDSKLFLAVTHQEEPFMPPKSDKIPAAEIDLIRKWIEGGALEDSGSVAAVKARPRFEFKVDADALGKPAGPPALPVGVSTEAVSPRARAAAVVAMAASPWAPLIAVAGFHQVLLYRTTDFHLAAVLPFPEGEIYVLRFSRNGDLLLAGGGRGGQSGLAVAWDVKNGKRVFEVGKEYDVVLAADISPDHGQVALGGPARAVRVYNTADGSLAFEMRKHTDWVTALEYSPDGVLLASGDRNNGLVVWEALTGREFHDLRGHASFITDVSWRLDSNVLASSSEDGTVKLWEMENGTAIKSIAAHGGGTTSVSFARDGRLLTSGRDRLVRLWDQNGNKQRDFEAFGDLALQAVATFDVSRAVASDWTGEIRVWDTKDGHRLTNLVVNPAPLADRLERARADLAATKAQAIALDAQLAPLQDAATAARAARDQAQARAAAAEQAANQGKAAVQSAEQALQTKTNDSQIARAAVQAAEQLAAQSAAQQKTAEAAVGQTAEAEKAAAEAFKAAQTRLAGSMSEKTAQDPALAAALAAFSAAKAPDATAKATAELKVQAQKATALAQALADSSDRLLAAQTTAQNASNARAAAPQTVEKARALARVATLAVAAARADVPRADQEKAAVEKTLAEARAALEKSNAQLAALAKARDQAAGALAAADKALAEKRAPLDAAKARAQALEAEANALAAEVKLFGKAKDGLASTDRPKP